MSKVTGETSISDSPWFSDQWVMKRIAYGKWWPVFHWYPNLTCPWPTGDFPTVLLQMLARGLAPTPASACFAAALPVSLSGRCDGPRRAFLLSVGSANASRWSTTAEPHGQRPRGSRTWSRPLSCAGSLWGKKHGNTYEWKRFRQNPKPILQELPKVQTNIERQGHRRSGLSLLELKSDKRLGYRKSPTERFLQRALKCSVDHAR